MKFRLELETILALLSTCGVDGVSHSLASAVIQTESSRYIYALSGSYENSHFFRLPQNESEVHETRLIAKGSYEKDINISLGLMQINSYHLNKWGYTPQQVFPVCFNIAVGTAILDESLSRNCGCAVNSRCLDQTLREYNTGRARISEAGAKYVKRVNESFSKLGLDRNKAIMEWPNRC